MQRPTVGFPEQTGSICSGKPAEAKEGNIGAEMKKTRLFRPRLGLTQWEPLRSGLCVRKTRRERLLLSGSGNDFGRTFLAERANDEQPLVALIASGRSGLLSQVVLGLG